MNTGTTMTKEATDAFNNSIFGRLVNALIAQEGITHGEAVRRTAEAHPDKHDNYLRSIGWLHSGEQESKVKSTTASEPGTTTAAPTEPTGSKPWVPIPGVPSEESRKRIDQLRSHHGLTPARWQ